MSTLRYTVCAAFVKSRITELIQTGIEPNTIYSLLNIVPESLSAPEKRIPIEVLVSLEKAAPILTQCPEIAFKVALECKNNGDSKSGIIGEIAASSNTIGEAFQAAARYSNLMSDAVFMDIHTNASTAEFICTRKSPDIYTLFDAESSMINAYQILRQYGTIHDVYFMHNKPSHVLAYAQLFTCSVHFDSPVTKIVFDKAILEKKNPYARPYVNIIIREHANKLLADTKRTNSVSQQVQRLINENISTALINIDFVAAKLNMSRQSLYRKLKDEKTTFSTLLDNVRKELATKYIQSSEYNMIEIAFLLGFSESSAFNRAYKRWFNKNPSQK